MSLSESPSSTRIDAPARHAGRLEMRVEDPGSTRKDPAGELSTALRPTMDMSAGLNPSTAEILWMEEWIE